jgi:hypothetical protein
MRLFDNPISLIFLNSKIPFESLRNDDFVNFDGVYFENDGEKMVYSLESDLVNNWNWKKNEGFSQIVNKNLDYDLLVEVKYETRSFGEISKSYGKKIQSIKLMSYDFLDHKSENKLVEFASEKRISVTEKLTILPKKTLERDTIGGKYNLGLLIVEFLRDVKLNNLGL